MFESSALFRRDGGYSFDFRRRGGGFMSVSLFCVVFFSLLNRFGGGFNPESSVFLFSRLGGGGFISSSFVFFFNFPNKFGGGGFISSLFYGFFFSKLGGALIMSSFYSGFFFNLDNKFGGGFMTSSSF